MIQIKNKIREKNIFNKNFLIITYDHSNFKNTVGGVLTASKRIIAAHKVLNFNFEICNYINLQKNFILLPYRLLVDVFNMIRSTNSGYIVYCLCDHNSFIRSILYISLSKLIHNKCFYIVDLRGGGIKIRLEHSKFFLSNFLLKIIYMLFDKIIIQTPKLEPVPLNYIDKVHYLPNTIENINLIQKTKKGENKLYKKRKFKIVYSGRISESKGIVNLLKIIQMDSFNNISFTFFGSLSLSKQNIIIFNELIKQNKINFYPNLGKKVLFNLLKDFDLFLFPSIHKTEGMPNSILDAISVCLPVLTTKCGFIEDIFSDEHITFLDNNNIVEIINKINSIIMNYDFYKKKSKKALDFSLRNLAMKNYTMKLLEVYKSINL